MKKINSLKPNRSLFLNISKLFLSVSRRRKIQISALFVMQLMSATLEVLSIGSIIPFLSALTDVNKLMGNPHIAVVMTETGISDSQNLIVFLTVLFTCGVVTANIFRFLTLLFQQYLSAAIAVDLGQMLFSRTLYKPYAFFLKNNTSHLIGNLTNDLNGTMGIVLNAFSFATQALIALFIAISLLFYNIKIAIILSIVIVISYSFIMYLVNSRLRSNSGLQSDSYRNAVQTLQESFGGIRYVIMDRLQKNFAKKYSDSDWWFRRKSAENTVILQAPKFFLESIGIIAFSAITINFMGQHKNIAEIIPLMGFLVFGCYRLLPAVQQVYSSLSAMISLSVSLERVVEIISQHVGEDKINQIADPINMGDTLRFENVYFDYRGTGENWTIQNLNFTIKAKTTIALVGHTGSGKSTISDLILGLIQPQKGHIKIDDVSLDLSNAGKWQAGISHVPQSIFLSDATIAENIAFGIPKKEIDMERVHHASQMAQLHDFILTLPGKYEEKVGERGIRLSGGQCQRIGIARSLYQNPSLIVFDEATSALDNKTEQDVISSIDSLKHKLTIVLIAHRLSTVKNADNILVFEKGCLVAQGKYEALLQDDHFKKLVKSEELD